MANIKIILGSIREGRKSESIGKWVLDEARKISNADFEIIDPKEYPLPLFSDAIPPAYTEKPYKDDVREKLSNKIDEADGFIFITPEYNHGYTSVMKNLLDSFYKEWTIKPGTFVSYGGAAGGSRAVEQLRQVLVELQMVPIREAIHIVGVFNAFDDRGLVKEEIKSKHKLDDVINKIVWWSEVLKEARSKVK